VYVARLFFRQTIALGKERSFRGEDQNKLPAYVPSERLVITFGKFSISDIFDGNVTSHDPKTSLLNWSMMDAGAWDYPSNTRGYTYALSLKFVKKRFTVRVSTAVAARWSNGAVTENLVASPTDWLRAHGEIAELIVPYKRSTFKLTLWANHAPMGSYAEATRSLLADTSAANREVAGPTTSLGDSSSHLVSPAMDRLRNGSGPYYGKFGFIAAWEINLGKPGTENNMVFARVSWNNGARESWMYTEIDESACVGAFFTAEKIKRPDDILRVAVSVNGISKQHADYLRAGGYGFIIGDGLGNYPKGIRPEFIVEAQYNFKYKFMTITPDYQFIVNPGYNPARGPVNVLSLRAHFEI
jgi:high affinity Mn2+ porin